MECDRLRLYQTLSRQMLEFDRLEFRPYCRPFKQPLQTHHGVWRDRRGILLRGTTVEGQVQWGEIAPIEFFGTESLEMAIEFCQDFCQNFGQGSDHRSEQRGLGKVLTIEMGQIPVELPACQFGFGMLAGSQGAGELGNGGAAEIRRCSWLLPSGAGAIAALHRMEEEALLCPGMSLSVATASQISDSSRTLAGATFKWKIGVASVAEEMAVFEELLRVLPARSKLRLDANGGLDWQGACRWLKRCDAWSVAGRSANDPEIEFLEQPLPSAQFAEMVKLGDRFSTPLALDESVATIAQLQRCCDQGWQGIFVVKAAIAGDPTRLLDLIRSRQLDVVWSSGFETAIARRFMEQRLMLAVPSTLKRAIGFGVGQWFEDGWDGMEFEELWQIVG